MDNETEQRVVMIIAVYIITIQSLTVNFMANVVSFLMKRQGRLRQITFQQVVNSTPSSYVFPDFVPISLLFNKKPRSIWMKNRSADWWERIVQLHFTNDDWLETFRMTKSTFLWLCDELRQHLTPQENQLGTRQPISVEKQVAITLYYLASCCEYRVVANVFGIHKCSVWKCVHKVVNAINTHLKSTWLSLPDKNECRTIAANFEAKTHLPQIIGAIDGFRDYMNRKGWPSIILQAVVDDKFRNIHIGTPGSAHDAAVFENSYISQYNDKLIPHETRSIQDTPIPYLIIGDTAYPLCEWLMKGYIRNVHLTPQEESLHVYLNSARVCAEIAFGRIKARWRRILKRIDTHHEFASHITFACCILHNIVETQREVFRRQWEREAAAILSQPELQQPDREASRMRDNIDADNIREALKLYMAANFPLRRTFIAT